MGLTKRAASVLILILLLMLSGCQNGTNAPAVQVELKLATSGQGMVTPEVGIHEYLSGTVVTLSAVPAPGWEFSYWIGEVEDSFAPETKVLLDGDKSVTAVFYHEEQSILINVADQWGSGIGGVPFYLSDGSSLNTNDRGFAVLNTAASSILIAPKASDFFYQPQAAVAEKGDSPAFLVSPVPNPPVTFVELSFNPAVFSTENGTARLNPFSVPKIREAMNRLVNRSYIADNIYAGTLVPCLTYIHPKSFDYEFISDVLEELEQMYSWDKEAAQAVIAEEMVKLGAELIDNQWCYHGEAVELVFLIRSEDERRILGDYIADELESIGFQVERVYLTESEASSIWLDSDPSDGLWHLYTNAWARNGVQPLQGHLLAHYYTADRMPFLLWQDYNPEPDLLDAAGRLNTGFDSLSERKAVLKSGLELALQDSVRIWLGCTE